ncbi:hypothetical protein J2X98_004219 [Pseudarthrobacter enclensis]|uniref:Uncharacterized protein n=1 Tax=Pseudarthrobacter enclensis TaxID=993070 RepID=A0ABT9S0U3_9MICC|nr:hypothetical protein [Pseudarthrobacter enclensis]
MHSLVAVSAVSGSQHNAVNQKPVLLLRVAQSGLFWAAGGLSSSGTCYQVRRSTFESE